MGEMLDIVSTAGSSSYQDILDGCGTKCLILFPTEDARTYDEITLDIGAAIREREKLDPSACIESKMIGQGWNVIVIDGTWSQARKMHAKHFPNESSGMLFRVQLSSDAVENLVTYSQRDENEEKDGTSSNKGLQLRRHPIKVRMHVIYCLRVRFVLIIAFNVNTLVERD